MVQKSPLKKLTLTEGNRARGLGEERVKWVYPIKSFIEKEIRVPMSSDCPATSGEELINPFLGIYLAVNRKTDLEKEIGSKQKIGVYEALKSYTINSTYACFEEDIKGSIELGKLADMIILDKNPLTICPEEIKDIKVLKTIISGEILYSLENSNY